MKRILSALVMVLAVAITAGSARADSSHASSVVNYAGYFMNWNSSLSFHHDGSYAAGADLSWVSGAADAAAAGWGGDADGGTLTLGFETAFAADGTAAADILVTGCGFGYNTPFSLEKGAITVYASSNGTDWTVISDYAGYDNGTTWEANPDFTESAPGVMATIMAIDLDDETSSQFSGAISHLKFELGDGATGHGRAFFVDAVQGVSAYVNQAPTADAGDDQSVSEGAAVSLNGSGSSDPEGGTLAYQWTQTAGTTVSLSGSTSASCSFTAPDVAAGEVLTFLLTVTDSANNTDTDEVQVAVSLSNQPPTAAAGADQTVEEGETVTLNGSGSDPEGGTLSYQWEQTAGAAVSLSNATSASCSFTAPDVAAAGGVLTFRLTVSDSAGLTSTDEVQVTVSFVNQAPTADAGADQTVEEGDTVALNGSGSSDPEGDTLTYQWEQTAGTTVSLSGTTSASCSFTAPEVEVAGTVLTFRLTVTDGNGRSGSDSVQVTVGDKQESGSVFATAVVSYGAAIVPADGIFMNWNSTLSFHHDADFAAGADLGWVLGPADAAAAGWGGDANGGYLVLSFETPITGDGAAGADILVHGCGYAYNVPFSAEKGAITVSASSDGVTWTVISDYAGYGNGGGWEANPDFTESAPGIMSTILVIDLDDGVSNTFSGAISYLKFELGDGAEGNGRAFFIDAVEGGNVNAAPVANAGADQEVNPGATVTLDASGSTDIDDGIVSYHWAQVDATAATAVVLDDALAVKPVFTVPEAPGETLAFQLTVTDNAGQTDTDTVEIAIVSAFDITLYSAASVQEESGCISLETQAADGGEHALGLPDYVPDSEGDCSGWNEASGYLILRFKKPLSDRDGLDDLAVAHLGTGQAEVFASADGSSWTGMGSLPEGAADGETISYAGYDFADSGIDAVQFVKIVKTGTSARFIDSVFVPLSIYGAVATDTDADYPSGCVDWVAKQADSGENALGEPDYDDTTPGVGNCSGWMVEAGRLTIGFDKVFFDGKGDDLKVYHFGRGGGDVQVSGDGVQWTSLGVLPEGLNGGSRLDAAGYDLGAFGVSSAQYVRINKTQVGYTYGRFIDAVEGVYGIPGVVGAAGRDQTVVEGEPVTLGADGNAEQTATFSWQQTGGTSVVLSDSTCGNPQFIAPMVDGQSVTLRFQLIKTDDTGTSEDEVQVVVVDNGLQLSSDQAARFSHADFVFNNTVGAANTGADTCPMGLSCPVGDLIAYEAQNPDSQLSDDYIDDYSQRPKNLIYGLLSFRIKAPAAGGTVAVSIYLPEAAGSQYKWYKHSTSLGWLDFSRSSISGGAGDGAEFNSERTVVTVYITDGGPYDDDGMADGFVQDPSGMGDSSTVGTWHDEGGGGGGGCFIDTLMRR